MMKFFRKYNKHMLAVFMALLLIVWLADDAIRRILQPDDSSFKVASVYGREIRQRDMLPVFNATSILDSLYPYVIWRMPWYASMRDLDVTPGAVTFNREPLNEMEWYMLVAEARRQGIPAPPGEIERIKAELPDPERALDFVRERHHVGLADIDAALADYVRVLEAARRAAGGVIVTEPEIYEQVKQVAEKVRVEFVLLPASSFVDEKAPLDEEEMKTFLQQYKDTPANGDPDTGYGYQLPAAVQCEYVKIDVDEIARNVAVPADDPWNYWKAHPSEFQHKPTTAQATQPGFKPTTMPFSEARQQVIAKLQKDRAKQEALKLGSELLNRLTAAWGSPPVGENGYAKAPAEMRDDQYLSKQIDALRRPPYGTALRYFRTNWVSQQDASREPGIGQATLIGSKPPVSFAQAVMQVEGLVATKPAASQPGSENYVSLYQPGPSLLSDPQGNVYVYRLVNFRTATAPAGLEEVRQQVEKDLRESKGYKAALEAARRLEQQAGEQGLMAAFNADAGLAQKLGPINGKVQTPPPFARMQFLDMGPYGGARTFPASVPGIGSDERFIRECFRLGAAAAASAPTTRSQRLALVEMKRQKCVVVVEWKENLPIRQDEYDQVRAKVLDMLRSTNVGNFVRDYYNADQIKRRVQWKDIQPRS